MAADLHQEQLLFPPTASPRAAAAPLFLSSSCSGSGLTSPSDSTSREVEGKELTRPMAHYMLQDDDHLYFQQSGSDSEECLNTKSWGSADWHHHHQPHYNHLSSICCPIVERQSQIQRGGLPHDIIDSFEKMSLVAKEPTSVPNHVDRLGLVVSANTIRALQLNQTEQLMRQSVSAYRKPHPKSERRRPSFQQQLISGGSGMRAVFLGGGAGSRSSTSSCGTGVFLPRATESSRKPRCSTVLIPARVVQALMVHFDKMEARSRGGGFPPQYGEITGQYYFQQENQGQPQVAAPARYQYDSTRLCLPQEWMY